MIKLNLPHFDGESVEIEPNSVIDFPAGVPGFETCTKFKLFHEEGKPNVIWLQSLDEPELLFSLRDPELMNLSYGVTLSDADEKLLESAPGDKLAVAVMVYKDKKVDNKPSFIKTNMVAPFILNVSKRRGMQKVLQDFDARVAISGT
jgi:flagellar assembly factor FliW